MSESHEFETRRPQPFPLIAVERTDERKLVRDIQDGNQAAFEELLRRHWPKVLGLVRIRLGRRADAEDVAQQVFLKVHLSIKRFDGRANFATWVYRIAVNECWDYLRKRRSRPLLYESDLSKDSASKIREGGFVEPSSAFPELLEDRQVITRILRQLPERDRQLLMLREIEGFSLQELAVMFKLNPNTVRVRLYRVRIQINKQYQNRAVSEP